MPALVQALKLFAYRGLAWSQFWGYSYVLSFTILGISFLLHIILRSLSSSDIWREQRQRDQRLLPLIGNSFEKISGAISISLQVCVLIWTYRGLLLPNRALSIWTVFTYCSVIEPKISWLYCSIKLSTMLHSGNPAVLYALLSSVKLFGCRKIWDRYGYLSFGVPYIVWCWCWNDFSMVMSWRMRWHWALMTVSWVLASTEMTGLVALIFHKSKFMRKQLLHIGESNERKCLLHPTLAFGFFVQITVLSSLWYALRYDSSETSKTWTDALG
jgi:hypothetical protein